MAEWAQAWPKRVFLDRSHPGAFAKSTYRGAGATAVHVHKGDTLDVRGHRGLLQNANSEDDTAGDRHLLPPLLMRCSWWLEAQRFGREAHGRDASHSRALGTCPANGHGVHSKAGPNRTAQGLQQLGVLGLIASVEGEVLRYRTSSHSLRGSAWNVSPPSKTEYSP
jgi:hypothetical protein